MARSAAAAKAAPSGGSLFDTAPALTKPTPPNGRDQAVTVEFPGLRDYVAIVQGGKLLTAMQTLEAIPLQEAMMAYFVAEGCRISQTPANYKGTDREASASLELRRKASNQPLSDEAVEALEHAGIPVYVNTIQPASFVLNPKYLAEDPAMVDQVGVMLKKAGFPLDLFLRQEEVSTRIVTDEMVTAIFEKYGNKKGQATCRLLLGLVASAVIRGEWDGDPKDAAAIARDKMVADAKLPADERAVPRANAIEKVREKARVRVPTAPVVLAASIKDQLAASLKASAAEGKPRKK
jgi:hypothetical protein